MSNPHKFVGGTFFRLCVLCGRESEINDYEYHFSPDGNQNKQQRTSAWDIADKYRELLSHANGENMELRAENRRLKAALRKIRVDCFDDSEWAQIIDSALSGKP